MKNRALITAIIIAKNEQEMIVECVKSLSFVEEIIVIDNNSTDDTAKVAIKNGAKVYSSDSNRFDEVRNFGLKKAENDWIFYIDADERVSRTLQKNIETAVLKQEKNAYFVNRKNFFLKTRMYDDRVERLFYKPKLIKWVGKVHETPVYEGDVGELKGYLEHHTHRDITSMLEKTNQWSQIEAQLRIEANHPPVKQWRVWRIAFTEFHNQFFQKKVYKYGVKGWIEGLFQVMDKIIVYIKLWEKQQNL